MRVEARVQHLLYLGPVLLVAFALRAYRLGWQSLWYDEGNSAFMTSRSLPEIIAAAAADIHPPLYYILLNWWSHLAGTSEFGLRFLSLAFGLLLVAVVYKLGQRLFLPQAGLAAAAIAAISPFLVYYSQEARMYMLGAFFSALAGLFFLKALEGMGRAASTSPPGPLSFQERGKEWEPGDTPGTPAEGVPPLHSSPGAASRTSRSRARRVAGNLLKDRYWVAYSVAAAAALYTQYYTLGVILAFNVFFVFAFLWRSGWALWARWLAANLAVALLYLPWLPALASQAALWPKGGSDLDMMSGLSAWPVLVWLLGPLQPLDNSTLVVMVYSIGLALALLALSAWGWPVLARALRGHPRGALGRSLGLLFILAATLVPWLSLLPPLWRPAFNPKFLTFGLPWLYLWLGLGVVSLACAGRYFFHAVTLPFRRQEREVLSIPWLAPLVLPTSLPLLSLGLAALLALQWYYFDPRYARSDYRSLVGHIEAQAQPDDAIVLNAPGQTEVFGYYYTGQVPVYPLPRQRPLDTGATGQELEALASNHSRLWLVLWGERESDPNRFIERWLDQRAYKAAERWFGGVHLALYSLPPPGEERRLPLEAKLGDQARLVGASLPSPRLAAGAPLARAAPGDILPLTLYWEARAPTPQPYKVFVHLLGPRDTLWGQHDSEPAGGSHPTTDWRPGEVVADNHGLPVLPGTPPGDYEIEVGLYDLATGQRLAVSDAAGNPMGDRVVLGSVLVDKPAAFPPRESLDIAHPLEVRYRELLLMGYEFFKLGTERGNVDFRRGDLAHLALFWRAEARPVDYYPVLVALLNSGNQEVARFEGLAAKDYPTPRWDPGEVVRDQYKLPLSVPPGSYRLTVVVTHAGGDSPIQPTGQNLKLVDGKLLLTEFQVK